MDDEKIIELYFARKEEAITQTKTKYGRYCHTIAYNVLHNDEDAEECVNDTYLDAWQSIPPHKPKIFSVFLGAITRRISLDRWRRQNAEKRGGGETMLSLHELEECIPQEKGIDEQLETKRLAEIISTFLRTLPETEANVFIRRYFYFDSIADIAKRYDFGESKTKMMLKRTREKLLNTLKKEDIFI
ncbi:MAG: sigma-70 family RNA polymerase sigma factor [Clostridia bacterium]|nr:sigma-70 family RNA polymerase sigma factor [Clostridia bacterium]